MIALSPTNLSHMKFESENYLWTPIRKRVHNITQRRGPSEFNSEMLGVPSESESPGAEIVFIDIMMQLLAIWGYNMF